MSGISFSFNSHRPSTKKEDFLVEKEVEKKVYVYSAENHNLVTKNGKTVPARLTTTTGAYNGLTKILNQGQTLLIYFTMGIDQFGEKDYVGSEWDYMVRIVKSLKRNKMKIIASDSGGNKSLDIIPYSMIPNYLHGGYSVVVQVLNLSDINRIVHPLDLTVKKEGVPKGTLLDLNKLTLVIAIDAIGSELIKGGILRKIDSDIYFQPEMRNSDDGRFSEEDSMDKFYQKKYISQIIYSERELQACDVSNFEYEMSNDMYRGCIKPPLLNTISKTPLEIFSLIFGYFPCGDRKIIALHHNPAQENDYYKLLLSWYNVMVGSTDKYYK